MMLLTGLVVFLGAVGTASGLTDVNAGHPDGFKVSRLVEAKELVVHAPTEIDRPSMTGNRLYLRLDCFAAPGRRVVSTRKAWPDLTPYHFHVAVSPKVLSIVRRCRLIGPSTPFETEVVDGPRGGGHPVAPGAASLSLVDPFAAP